MSTATPCDCPLRNFQTCAAASPAAAMLACAAAPRRNDDGSCGSSAVSVTASSADGSPPASVQRSARISRGVCIGGIPQFTQSSYAGLTGESILRSKDGGHCSLMKIPRLRQDAHVARMADFLGRIVRVLAPIVMQRFDQCRAGWHSMLSAECVIGKINEITGAVEQSLGDEMHDLLRTALNTSFDQHQPRAHDLLAKAF